MQKTQETQQPTTSSPIGRDTPRVDGPAKVCGVARYTSDHNFPGQLYAVPVEATIATGRVTRLDTAAAERMPGVRAIFHRANIGKIFRSTQDPAAVEGITEERRPPFEDDVVRYNGQYVALAVADTFEAAKAAAWWAAPSRRLPSPRPSQSGGVFPWRVESCRSAC
jgi:xanthine dehydrogenase YagR molybdenum-binding subunit